MVQIPIDQVVKGFDVLTHNPTTSAISDADSVPTFDVFEEDNDTPILGSQSCTKRTGKTGDYRGAFTASLANGFEAGKCYTVVTTVIVGGVTAKKQSLFFRIVPAESAVGVPKVDVADWLGATAPSMAGDAYSALTIAANAEPTSVPASNATLAQKIAWCFTVARNKLTQTATTQAVRNNADSGAIGSAIVSDDGTVFTRGKYT